MITVLLVGVGGFLGTVARYLVDSGVSYVTNDLFPWGTLVINATGSFALGVLFALVMERAVLPVELRMPLMVGFLGAYTTFSTYMLESWRLYESGSWALAAANLVGSVAVGLIAVVGGLALGRSIG